MNVQEASMPRLADLEKDIRCKITQRTHGRIRALEVKVLGAHIEVQGFAASFHLKQLAIQGAFDVIGSAHGSHVDLDVQIRVEEPASSVQFS